MSVLSFGQRIHVAALGAVLVGGACLTPFAAAQTAVDGAIAGTVSDATGALVPKATVVVHSTATNLDTPVTTDASGYFRASRLQPGEYTVSVTAPGFAGYSASNVVIEVGKLTELSPKLAAGGASATVEVSSQTPVMNTETSDFSTEFNPAALATLPINGRHWTAFALLSPGVTLGNNAFGQVTFRGISNLQNNYLVDGSDDNQAFQAVERGYTRVGYSTAQDAILEFQVNTSNYSAQYGRAVGGGVNAVTRSGSNQFHGDAFEYYRDNDFGATNPFNILQTVPTTVYVKPKDKRHQYGGSFSGPLIHDKLFFLFAFDQQKRNFPIVAVPTPQFLAVTNAAYNNCTVLAGGTTDANTCSLSRGLTQAQINSALSYINGQSGIAPRQGDQILNFAKLDYTLNSRNTASVIYNRMRWDSPNGTQTNPVIRRGLTSIGNDYVKVDSYIAKIDTVLSPRSSNELRVEYARDLEIETGNTPFANEPTTTAGGLPPGVSILTNSQFNVGTPYYVPRALYPDERESEVADNVTMTLGHHTLNIGADYRWVQDNVDAVNYLHGLFTYARFADFITDFARSNGAAVGCDANKTTARGTLPCYTTLTQAFGRPQFVYHTNEYAGYVQDDWKLLPNLTLNLGVRYDFEQLPQAKIPNVNVPVTANMPSDKNNIAPRIGFAWDAFKTGKTLVHGGFGLYYGRILNGTIYNALATTGSPQAQFQVQSSGNGTNVPVYPNIVSAANPPTVSNVLAFQNGYQAPVADEIDASVQQELGWNTVFGVAYLGSLGKQLPNFIDANIAPATTTRTYSFTGGPLAGAQWTVPLYTARLNGATNALTLVRSNVNTSYNALSVTMEHRLSKGVQFQGSYTWSKALDYDMNQTQSYDTNDPADPYSVAGDYARSVNDIPQRFVGNLTIQPKVHIANRYASLAANGWTLAPVWTVQSGIPYNYGLSGGSSIPGGATSFNGSGGGNYVNFWAYRNLANTQLPSVRRNSGRQTNIDDVDVRLSRAFALREKYRLTISGEAFNLMNRENFTAFNTTAYTLTGTTATYQSSFGTPSAAGNTIYRERQIQFVGRFEF